MTSINELKKEITKEIEELADYYKLGKVIEIKKSYKKIFWWRIEFTEDIKKSLNADVDYYEGIHFMPYFVGQKLLDDVNLWENKLGLKEIKNRNEKEYVIPNIDRTSGNLHPIWTDEKISEWCEAPAVKQVVLVRKIGKRWGVKRDNLPLPKGEIRFSDIADPCCYYPKTDSDSDCHFTTEELLKGLLMQVLDKEKVMKNFGKENKLYQLMSEKE